jgi:hypothetical protein
VKLISVKEVVYNQPECGFVVDSVYNINENQESSSEVKGGSHVRLMSLPYVGKQTGTSTSHGSQHPVTTIAYTVRF